MTHSTHRYGGGEGVVEADERVDNSPGVGATFRMPGERFSRA
jgi:hypothetical protein